MSSVEIAQHTGKRHDNVLRDIKETNMGRNQMFKFLRDKKIFTKANLPYQSYINKGYFVVNESIHNNIIRVSTSITPLGQQKLLAFLTK